MYEPKITPYQLNEYSYRTAELYSAIEQELFLAIARRLKAPPELGKDHVLAWQVERMQQLRMYNNETIKILADYTGIAEKEIDKAIKAVGYDTAKDIDTQLAEMTGKEPPITAIDTLITGLATQAKGNINNFVNQTLITTALGVGKATEMYTLIVSQSVAQVLAGNKTVNQSVTDTIIKNRAKGMPTSFIDKGGNNWRMEHYVENVIRSTVNNTYNEVRTARMDDFGIDLVRVSSHIDSRPICSRIQGQVASIKEYSIGKYPSIYDYGYGTASGIRGSHCRHIFYPFVEGMSTNNEIQFDQKKVEETYKKTQVQRKLELKVREAKYNLQIAEATGDKDKIDQQKQKIRNEQATLRTYVADNGLPRMRHREQIVR